MTLSKPSAILPLPRSDLTVAVLAGGRGERMGGADKGLVRLAGRPLLSWVLDTAPADAGGILIVANRHSSEYASFGHPVVSDSWPDFRGPLAGMLAALEHARSPWVLTLPCDAPRLPPDLLPRLWNAAASADASAAYATANDHAHPPCSLIRRDLAPQLRRALDAGERAPYRWLRAIGAATADFSDSVPAPLWSANTAEELAQAEALLAESVDG
jgi:molybdopterin-guanine dinucleotide biosynthesis protein A